MRPLGNPVVWLARAARGRAVVLVPADVELLRDLARIADDARQPRKLRAAARLGFNMFAAWMLAGRPRPTRRLALYGRYCGPGHSGPGEPVDAIDAACRRHDAAYKAAGM